MYSILSSLTKGEPNLTHLEIKTIYNNLKKQSTKLNDGSLEYSEITRFVFSVEEEDIEYVFLNIKLLEEYESSNKNELVRKLLNKIKVHIDLEQKRLSFLEKKQTEQLTKISENNIEKFKNIKEEIDS
ncbi:TPA: hypothetical protein UMH08_003516, partial [Clostridioides difficile]|nr:hypothetical protein [Clostridioides difficile]